jgi:nucleotide-binding universal stress UspA family protein
MKKQQNVLSLLPLLLSIILLGGQAATPIHQQSAYASTIRPTDGLLDVSINVINDNGGNKTVSDFTTRLTNTSGTVFAFQSIPLIRFALSPSTYTVILDPDSGYTTTFEGDCDSAGQLTLATGEQKTCTIKNDDVALLVSAPPATTDNQTTVTDNLTPQREGLPADSTCSDGIDNDLDGQVDRADGDCLEEISDDGIDNNDNGQIEESPRPPDTTDQQDAEDQQQLAPQSEDVKDDEETEAQQRVEEAQQRVEEAQQRVEEAQQRVEEKVERIRQQVEEVQDEEPKAPVAITGDNIYVAWWTNKTGNDEVLFRASTDDGVTFGDKTNLSNTTDADSTRVEIDSDTDNVVVTWWETNDTSDIPVMRVSNDNGETFGPLLKLSTNGTIGGE